MWWVSVCMRISSQWLIELCVLNWLDMVCTVWMCHCITQHHHSIVITKQFHLAVQPCKNPRKRIIKSNKDFDLIWFDLKWYENKASLYVDATRILLKFNSLILSIKLIGSHAKCTANEIKTLISVALNRQTCVWIVCKRCALCVSFLCLCLFFFSPFGSVQAQVSVPSKA